MQNGAREFPKALRAARQAFPFLESLARWAWRCQAPLETNANAATAATAATVTAAAAAAAVTATAGQLEGMESQGHVEEGRGSASADQGHRNRRGREDTGVASLLVALASADPSGETIRSMQRWACEALLPEQVKSVIAVLERELYVKLPVLKHGIVLVESFLGSCRTT